MNYDAGDKINSKILYRNPKSGHNPHPENSFARVILAV
jgi:hypothetical protein